jgi:acyl-CoA thioester hydrolase
MSEQHGPYPSSGLWVNEKHSFRARIYYESTDLGGIVYHSKYLTFAEHARTESLRGHGINQRDIFEREGVSLAVRHCAVDFQRPAHLDDLIEIQTTFEAITGARITLEQTIYLVKNEKIEENWLVRLRVQLACVSSRGRATRVPKQIRQLILDVILNR